MKIFKYEIPMPSNGGLSRVYMPAKAEPVSVGLQNDKMVLWVRIGPDSSYLEDKRFLVINTGQDASDCKSRFIGTVTSSNGIVWHVLEIL